MGIISNRIIEEGSRIGLWEIAEDYETLLRTTYLSDDDIQRLDTFKNENRKKESLSVRALLQQMTRHDARIVYCKNSRKPFLDDNSYNISITHSHKYTAILLNEKKQVGIDIEYMTHNIERVAHKFINEKEFVTNNPLNRREHLYVHWCAKEALYKICDKEDINFIEHLTIKPFEIGANGNITGIVNKDQRAEEYWMYYMIYDNYVLVYCIK